MLKFLSGHVDMVKFLLDAGADQEHKTDEMHTALMEASMVSTSSDDVVTCVSQQFLVICLYYNLFVFHYLGRPCRSCPSSLGPWS